MPATAPPVSIADILAEADRLLQPSRFEDYGPNGLQVPGSAGASHEVARIATGVSASAELFELAAAEHADLLLVHHGLFWGSGFTTVDAQLRRRLRLLFDADLALAAYHLPLDAHPELGNNALLAGALGATRLDVPFALHRGEPIGCLARFDGNARGTQADDRDGDENKTVGENESKVRAGSEDENASQDEDAGLSVAELIDRVRAATGGRDPLVFDAGPARVRTLGIVSGGGSDYIADAARAGAQAFLTGEPVERELGVTYIAAGHYATETFGIRALGEHLAARFGLRHVFLNVPNPV